MNKKDNYNLHPKKPHPSKQDELATVHYHWQAQITKERLTDKAYNPADDGKPNFQQKVKGVTTFSEGAFFNTVFVSGDDMVAEEQAIKKRQIEEWNSKVVVDNKHF